MGVGLAVAVLLDATLVRAVLLPAAMTLLGERNWYLPRRLHWLPRLGTASTHRRRCAPSISRHANRRAHRRRRLPRPQCGHPRHRPQGLQPRRPRVRRLPLRLGRRPQERGDGPHAGQHARDPAPRRDDPRVVPHEPVQGRRRRGRGARDDGGARPRRADPDRRRGHARRRRAAARGRHQRRRRPEDDRQRPGGHGLHVRLPDRRADRHRRDRPPAHDGRVAQPRDHRRGDGPPRRLDRALLRPGRRRRRGADPGAPVRHRRGLRAHPPPPRKPAATFSIVVVAEGATPADGDADHRAPDDRRVRPRPARRHRASSSRRRSRRAPATSRA